MLAPSRIINREIRKHTWLDLSDKKMCWNISRDRDNRPSGQSSGLFGRQIFTSFAVEILPPGREIHPNFIMSVATVKYCQKESAKWLEAQVQFTQPKNLGESGWLMSESNALGRESRLSTCKSWIVIAGWWFFDSTYKCQFKWNLR